MEDQEFLENLDKVDQQISSRPEGVEDNIKNMCEQYRNLRPTIKAVVGAIAFIPGIGKKVSRVVEFLMKLADGACDVERGGATG